MSRNVGNIDRAIRALLGVALLSLLVVLDGNARWLGWIGIVPLLTSALAFCPIYRLIGVDTCPVRPGQGAA